MDRPDLAVRLHPRSDADAPELRICHIGIVEPTPGQRPEDRAGRVADTEVLAFGQAGMRESSVGRELLGPTASLASE